MFPLRGRLWLSHKGRVFRSVKCARSNVTMSHLKTSRHGVISPSFAFGDNGIYAAKYVVGTRNFSSKTEDRTELLRPLREMLPHVEFSTNSYELERHGRGESYHPSRAPDAVVVPESVDDVVEIMKYCYDKRIPIVPFGVGTSVEGHVCCLEGGISLDMRLFQDIVIPDVSQDAFDHFATVGAGVTRKTLNQALRHTGLQFVVDPGADATLAGMVATGASGTTAVRYGTMRENLYSVECVLPDENATVVKSTGTKALKSSAGYDMTGLMCGSEGTLGVITSVTVKLHPIPEHITAAVCMFDSLADAARAVATIKLCDIPVLRCELLDESSIRAFNAYPKDTPDRDPKPTLFLEFQGSSESIVDEYVKQAKSICIDVHEGIDFSSTSDEDERRSLWAARHTLYYAAINLRPGATNAVLTDACVPLSQFADILTATAEDVEEAGVVGPCFGHAGDGNFHCILPVKDTDSEEYIQKVHNINDRLIRRTLEVGGTCTGEHGIGYGKIKYLDPQYGPGGVQLMKSIKQAIDPRQIMNPGKVVLVR